MLASKLDYIISIKKIEVTATGAIGIVARIKYKGQYATLVYDSGGWKFWHDGGIPLDVILDVKEEVWKRVQKIIEKIDDILALGGGLGLTIVFK